MLLPYLRECHAYLLEGEMCTVASPPVHSCSNCGHLLARPDIAIPTSPLPHLLDGNQYAEGSQISVIHDAITLPLLLISTLDDEISRQETALTELRRKRDGIESYVKVHRGLLAPFRWIPEDIMLEIFMHFKDEWGNKARFSVKHGPLAITGVCQRWRNIALRTPSLWSSIPVAIDSYHDAADWILLEAMLKTWLNRTKSYPLSITISGMGIDIGSTESWSEYAAREALAELLRSSVHWRNLHLVMPRLEEHLAPIKNTFPNLRHLSLGTPLYLEDGLHAFQTAPRLSSLTWFGYVEDFRHGLRFLLPAQWKQMQVLDCVELKLEVNSSYIRTSDCLAMLSLTPNLHTARLSFSSSLDQQTDRASRTVHLTQLHSLDIIYEGNRCDPSAFLNGLCTPALTIFKIAIVGPHAGPNCALALAAFLLQSLALCELTLSGGHQAMLWRDQFKSRPNILLGLLKHTPKLRKLDLRWCDKETLNADFLDVFAGSEYMTPSTTAFLPALTSLTLQDTCGAEVDMAALINVLRCRASRGLRDVTLLGQRSFPWELYSDDHYGNNEPTMVGSTLGLQDEDVIVRLRQLRDQVVNLKVFVEGRNVL